MAIRYVIDVDKIRLLGEVIILHTCGNNDIVISVEDNCKLITRLIEIDREQQKPTFTVSD